MSGRSHLGTRDPPHARVRRCRSGRASPPAGDPVKLARQIAEHGASLIGMPPPEMTRGRDGHFRINDGVTRATRAAKLRRGEPILVEVIATLPNLDVTRMPRIGDRLP